jgi:hypothetical protein
MDSVHFAEQVPLTPEQVAALKERAHDIEAGDTSRGHYVSGDYPPGAPLPRGFSWAAAPAPGHEKNSDNLAKRMSNVPGGGPGRSSSASATTAAESQQERKTPRNPPTSPPWIIHGERGSMWV